MSWTLLTIPPEIRDVIIETILLSVRIAPPDIASAATPPRTVVETSGLDHRNSPFLTWPYGTHNVKFEKPTEYTASSALPLLLTNRQLHAETRSAIARLDERVRCYELDVLVVNEIELWPTWTCVPVLTRCVERVDVTFRVYGRRVPDRDGTSAFGPVDGSSPSILWCFYFVLEHFLKRGPGGSLSIGEKDKEVCAKMINVDFVAGEGQEMLPEEHRVLWWRIQNGYGVGASRDTLVEDTRIMRPSWLAGFVLVRLVLLLSMNYHTAEYGALLHERVGVVRVLVNGELLNELDVARVLGKLAYNDAGNTFGHLRRQDRLSSFWQWKRDAVKFRGERGLAVAENIVLDSEE